MTAFSYPHGAVAHSVSPRPDASLFERHCHNGYELLFVLRGEGDYIVEGTLYPLLHSMEEKELLTAYEKVVGSKTRKYYSITKQGRKALAEKQDEWKNYAHAVLSVLEAGGVV